MFNLQQHEIAGIIAQIIALVIIVAPAKKWWLANQSLQWQKTKGMVVKSLDSSVSGAMEFLYSYEIKGVIHLGEKPFFANSFRRLKGKKMWDLIEKYPEGKEVSVFYNPSNPKISTLEPGRKDGVLTVIIVMSLLFVLGFVSQHFPILLWDIIGEFKKILY